MNKNDYNQLADSYIELGSWLASCKNLPPELLLSHLRILRVNVNNMLEDIDVIESSLRNHQA